MSPVVQSRVRPVIAALIIVLAGLSVRAVSSGPVANFAGSALYAAMIFAVILIWQPGAGVLLTACTALAVCFAVELFQLTPYPEELSGRVPAAHLVLGAGFQWLDLLAYVCGAVGGAVVLGSLLQLRRRGGRGLPEPSGRRRGW